MSLFPDDEDEDEAEGCWEIIEKDGVYGGMNAMEEGGDEYSSSWMNKWISVWVVEWRNELVNE